MIFEACASGPARIGYFNPRIQVSWNQLVERLLENIASTKMATEATSSGAFLIKAMHHGLDSLLLGKLGPSVQLPNTDRAGSMASEYSSCILSSCIAASA